jgi:hypothetical protein
MQVANGVLIGASHFPKSRNLKATPKAAVSVKTLERIIKENSVMGLSPETMVSLVDYQDNTLIKEQVFVSCSKKADVFFFYYCGNIVLRKDQLYIATPESSREMIYANGIAFHELLAMLQDSAAASKFIFIDAQYNNGDQELSEADKIIVEKILNEFANSIPDCVLISSHPGLPFHSFNGGYEATLLTTALVHCLKQGSKTEKPDLTLSDLAPELVDLMATNNEAAPFVAGKISENQLFLLPNHRFQEFEAYRKNADQLFDQAKFSEAFAALNHCLNLFPKNEEVRVRVEFIKSFVEGESKIETQDYASAYEAFSKAMDLIPNEKAKQNKILSLEKWAKQSFDTGKFETAKAKYELLSQLVSNSSLYLTKIKEVEAELAFVAAIDQADKLYYENQYQKAAQEYDKALQIRYDIRIARRKSECDALVEKEEMIKLRIESDIKEQVSKKFEQEFENEFLSRKRDIIEEEINQIQIRHQEALAALTEQNQRKLDELLAQQEHAMKEAREWFDKELEDKLSRAQQQNEEQIGQLKTEFEQKWIELDQKFWSALSLWNHPDGYQFYLDFFKEGKYIAKAQKRLAELQKVASIPSKDESHALDEDIDFHQEQVNLFVEDESTQEQIVEPNLIEPSQTVEPQVELQDIQAVPEPTEPAPKKELKFETIERPKRRVIVSEPEPEPVNMTEQELWDYATNGSSVESFMFYIDNSKEKKYIADAYYQINRIKKGQTLTFETDTSSLTPDFEPAATQVETPASQSQVSETQPDAQTQEELNLWLKATSENSIAAFYTYINNSKLKTYWNEAKDRIAQLKQSSRVDEQADWEEAENIGTVEAYQAYIRKYPLGNYYAQAMFKINKLQS